MWTPPPPQRRPETLASADQPEHIRPLGIDYPKEIYSLSHVALPFPMDDPLYGMAARPQQREQYGINLGGLALRGERGVLIVNPGALTRTSSNPFYPYLQQRVMETLTAPPVARSAAVTPASSGQPDAAYQAEVEQFLQESDESSSPF